MTGTVMLRDSRAGSFPEQAPAGPASTGLRNNEESDTGILPHPEVFIAPKCSFWLLDLCPITSQSHGLRSQGSRQASLLGVRWCLGDTRSNRRDGAQCSVRIQASESNTGHRKPVWNPSCQRQPLPIFLYTGFLCFLCVCLHGYKYISIGLRRHTV